MCFPFRVQSYVVRREWYLISELLLLYCFAPRVCDLSGRSLPCFATSQCHPLAHLPMSTHAMCNLVSHHAYGRVCKHLGDPAIHPGDVSTFMPSATAAQQATTSPPTTSQCHWVSLCAIIVAYGAQQQKPRIYVHQPHLDLRHRSCKCQHSIFCGHKPMQLLASITPFIPACTM